MTDRSILMLVNFFPPAGGGGVYRPLSFVRHLSRAGWRVTVVTPEPGEFWVADPALVRVVPDDVRVVRTPSLSASRLLGRARNGGGRRSSSGFGLLRRFGECVLLPDTYRGWVPFARRAAEELCRTQRFDWLYSTSPPDSTHLAALPVARRFGFPWVADFRDPWIGLHLRRPPTPLHAAIHRGMERRVAKADLVLVTTDRQRDDLLGRYPSARVVKIANGYEEEDFETLDVRPPDAPFTLAHFGMLTLGRSTRPFLAGLARLFERAPALRGSIETAFVGPRETANEEWVARYGLGDVVRFEDPVPHEACVRREAASHALLLVKHDDPRYRGLVPGKLYEYIGARRPILALVPNGEAAAIVRRLRRGEVAAIDDAGGIAAALERLYRGYEAGELERRYDLSPVPELSRRAGAERLAGLLEEMGGGG